MVLSGMKLYRDEKSAVKYGSEVKGHFYISIFSVYRVYCVCMCVSVCLHDTGSHEQSGTLEVSTG